MLFRSSHHELFKLCEDRGLPFHPVATTGFDNSPRWHRGATLPIDFRKLFYEPIVVDNPPAKYRLALQAAIDSIERQIKQGKDTAPRMLMLNAWNEWPEGNQLLPTTRHGLGYLEAVRDASRAMGVMR